MDDSTRNAIIAAALSLLLAVIKEILRVVGELIDAHAAATHTPVTYRGVES
jgi:hypothetical protein